MADKQEDGNESTRTGIVPEWQNDGPELPQNGADLAQGKDLTEKVEICRMSLGAFIEMMFPGIELLPVHKLLLYQVERRGVRPPIMLFPPGNGRSALERNKLVSALAACVQELRQRDSKWSCLIEAEKVLDELGVEI